MVQVDRARRLVLHPRSESVLACTRNAPSARRSSSCRPRCCAPPAARCAAADAAKYSMRSRDSRRMRAPFPAGESALDMEARADEILQSPTPMRPAASATCTGAERPRVGRRRVRTAAARSRSSSLRGLIRPRRLVTRLAPSPCPRRLAPPRPERHRPAGGRGTARRHALSRSPARCRPQPPRRGPSAVESARDDGAPSSRCRPATRPHIRRHRDGARTPHRPQPTGAASARTPRTRTRSRRRSRMHRIGSTPRMCGATCSRDSTQRPAAGRSPRRRAKSATAARLAGRGRRARAAPGAQ